MAVALSFPSTTPNFSLPLLFSGQAQKEFFVNQSLSLIDAILHKTLAGSVSSPPETPAEGDAYRVMATATQSWEGQEDKIAVFIAGAWQFLEPKAGMRFFDRAAGVFITYDAEWQSAPEPAAPNGGAIVDAEARQMLAELVDALRIFGLFANPT